MGPLYSYGIDYIELHGKKSIYRGVMHLLHARCTYIGDGQGQIVDFEFNVVLKPQACQLPPHVLIYLYRIVSQVQGYV
jgi:hypothetical protein